MNPVDYIESVKERLSTDSIVAHFDIIREFSTLNEGFIRVRAELTNDSFLDFSEMVKPADELEFTRYRYQWLDQDKKHIRRWDNAPHFPQLENFPHHVHVGENEVKAGAAVNIFAVLDEIAKIMGA